MTSTSLINSLTSKNNFSNTSGGLQVKTGLKGDILRKPVSNHNQTASGPVSSNPLFAPFVAGCVERPQYTFMARAYEVYRGNSRPCHGGATNQCAVRMSIALARAGFGLETFTPHNRVHDGIHCGTGGIAHVLGATELAEFLRRTLGAPRVYREQKHGGGCANAFAAVKLQRGILYFNNCFKRAGTTAKTGDHIDLFNGSQYYNEIIHAKAGGDETHGGNLFGRADYVWFWVLG